jgi:hypothetical protein
MSPSEPVADRKGAAQVVRITKVEQVLSVQAAHPAAVLRISVQHRFCGGCELMPSFMGSLRCIFMEAVTHPHPEHSPNTGGSPVVIGASSPTGEPPPLPAALPLAGLSPLPQSDLLPPAPPCAASAAAASAAASPLAAVEATACSVGLTLDPGSWSVAAAAAAARRGAARIMLRNGHSAITCESS